MGALKRVVDSAALYAEKGEGEGDVCCDRISSKPTDSLASRSSWPLPKAEQQPRDMYDVWLLWVLAGTKRPQGNKGTKKGRACWGIILPPLGLANAIHSHTRPSPPVTQDSLVQLWCSLGWLCASIIIIAGQHYLAQHATVGLAALFGTQKPRKVKDAGFGRVPGAVTAIHS